MGSARRREGRPTIGLDFDPDLAVPRKRSLAIAGHPTSVTLEDAFWLELRAAAGALNMTVAELASTIDSKRRTASLSASIRVFLLGMAREGPAGIADSHAEGRRDKKAEAEV